MALKRESVDSFIIHLWISPLAPFPIISIYWIIQCITILVNRNTARVIKHETCEADKGKEEVFS